MAKLKQTPAEEPVKIIIGRSKTKAPLPAEPIPSAPASKQETIIALLKRPKGASMDELIAATGWQRHSVRGTLSGVLKKRLGLPLITECGAHGRTYRIAGAR